MPDVPPTELARKPLVTIPRPRERPARPPACRRCGGRSWWNGWRRVFPVVLGLLGVAERWELWLARAKCASCRHAFTCYPSEVYPHRQYQLDVVAETVARVAVGGESVVRAAAAATASLTSARRWMAWVAKLAAPADLLAAAARIDPDGPAGAGMPSARSRAAQVLLAFEHLGTALLRCGLAAQARTGLGRVLAWQRTTHGDVYGLVAGVRGLSPPMVLAGRGCGP